MDGPEFLEKITAQFEKKRPFVAYRKPKENAVKAILQADSRLHLIKTFSESGFVFAPFDSEAGNILLKPDEILECSDISMGNLNVEGKFPIQTNRKSSLTTNTSESSSSQFEDELSYQKLIDKATDEIKKGTFQKVVLSRRIEVELKTTPVDLFQKLLTWYPDAFCYFWYHPKIGIWIGATPEILLMLRHRHLTTMSLAGTQKFSGADNPEWGKKELEEQELVTEFIIEALKDKVSNLERTPTETVRAGALQHLRTKISGMLESINNKSGNLDAIIKALHPTPAVCGLPKKSALSFITKNENYDREFYTGFLGELNMITDKQRSANRKNQENQAYRSLGKSTTLFVNLRCMKLDGEKSQIFVGGGITKDSDPEREWDETVAKSETMLNILR